jgi:hypothetical protein
MIERRTGLLVVHVLVGSVLVASSPAVAGTSTPPWRGDTDRRSVGPGQIVAVDVAAEAGLSSSRTKTWSAAPADFDRDGDEDVLIGYHPVEKLWRNEGDGTYERVARGAWPGRAIDRHNCAWADVDRNGLPDVMCATGRGLANRVKGAGIDNELWLQTAEARFEEVGTEWGIGDPCGRGRDVTFLDANGDRYPDLFVGNHTPRDVPDPCDGSRRYPNERSKLYLNVGGTRFVHAPRKWPYGGGAGTRCLETLDYDRDGWVDLFACRAVGETPRLYRNVRGRGFVDVTSRHRLAVPISDAHVFRLGAGRYPDLVTAIFSHRNRGGRFLAGKMILEPPRGVGMAVAAGDADGDGDQDVYAMIGNGPNGNPDDRILLRGRAGFRAVRAPGAAGAADDVVALHRFDDGVTEFLSLNGYNLDGRGPVQLIRLVHRK